MRIEKRICRKVGGGLVAITMIMKQGKQKKLKALAENLKKYTWVVVIFCSNGKLKKRVTEM